jgi:3-methyladenine DNA glycosylase AlkD
MKLQQVLQQLEALGTEQNRKIYRRHGASDNQFGVSFANLGKLTKQIKIDHELAVQLWNTANDDARNLATMIADPARLTARDLDRWARSLTGPIVCSQIAALAARTPQARACAESWIDADDEWIESTGWLLLCKLLESDPTLTDAWCAALLQRIERDIHAARNKVRDIMNSALICIGIRNPKLQVKALAAAKRIGKVEVDHGETGCKTPEATAYILKTLKHREEKAKKAAARKK